MLTKKRPHKAWAVLFACFLLEASTVGILWNCAGLFYPPICQELGFRTGDFSIFTTLRNLTGAFTVTFLVTHMKKTKFRPYLMALVALYTLSFASMAFSHHLYQFYLAGILVGIAGSSTFMVIVSLVINNWFYKYNGFAVGLAMSASGLGGAIFSPVVSTFILKLGWRNATIACALLTFLITIPAILLIVCTPEKVGLKPYGYGEKLNVQQHHTIITRELPKPKPVIALCILMLGAAYFLSQYNAHLPLHMQDIGYSLNDAAILTSIVMLGNVCSKLLLGYLADKKNAWFSSGVGLLFALFGFLLMGSSHLLLLCIGGFFFGSTMALSTITPPLVSKEVFGLAHYEKYYTRFITINQVISACAFSIIGYSHDIFKGFQPSFWLGFGLAALSLLAMFGIIYLIRGTKTTP